MVRVMMLFSISHGMKRFGLRSSSLWTPPDDNGYRSSWFLFGNELQANDDWDYGVEGSRKHNKQSKVVGWNKKEGNNNNIPPVDERNNKRVPATNKSFFGRNSFSSSSPRLAMTCAFLIFIHLQKSRKKVCKEWDIRLLLLWFTETWRNSTLESSLLLLK